MKAMPISSIDQKAGHNRRTHLTGVLLPLLLLLLKICAYSLLVHTLPTHPALKTDHLLRGINTRSQIRYQRPLPSSLLHPATLKHLVSVMKSMA